MRDLFFNKELMREFESRVIGFDAIVDSISQVSKELGKYTGNFPPYNIRKDSETKYTIEMAVAGFGKQEIAIDLEGDKLIVKGKATEDDSSEYLFKGMANRAFTRQFTLNDQVVVQNATMLNGILKIALERIAPEAPKSRTVPIEEPNTVSDYVRNPIPLNETDLKSTNGKLM